MSRPSGEHLTRISINIPTDNLETMKNEYPTGYQLKIREMIQEHCRQIKNTGTEQPSDPEEESMRPGSWEEENE